jgi:hypothetical protein
MSGETATATIDEAWAAAAASLPEYWFIRSLIYVPPDVWEAVAYEGNQIRVGRGPSPVAALLDLVR